MSFHEGFREINFQPAQADGRPICPHYQLIEICAKFVGIKEKDLAALPMFCGEDIQKYDRMGILSGSRGYDHTARATCVEILKKLTPKIALARKAIVLPRKAKVISLVNGTPDLKEKEKILADYNAKKGNLKERRALIAEWRKVVFNVSIIPASENQEVKHFRKVQKPRDLSEYEVLNTVNSFFEQLSHIVGQDTNWVSKAAKNCDQSPKTYEDALELS